MMLITELPCEIVIHLFVDWLDISSCCRLDSSFCCHDGREVVLSTLKDRTLVFTERNAGCIDNREMLEWIWKKRIAIESMIIPSSSKACKVDYEALNEYLREKGCKILKLGETHFDEKSYGFFSTVPTYMNTSQLSTLLRFCPNMMEINDLSTECITLVSMGTMRRYCRNLRVLSIQHHEFDYWDPTPLIALVAGGDCPLTSLRLPSIQKFVGKFAIIARNLPHLECLCCDRLRDISACESDDKTFATLAQHCPKLKALRLPMMLIVGDSSLIALSHGCCALQLLDVSQCAQITSAGLALLARSCTGLTSVNLSQCRGVGAEGVAALARHCKNHLRQLHLDQVVLLTDTALEALGAHCTALKDLNVAYCELLTSAGIEALAVGCTQLSRLDVSCCHGLSAQCTVSIATHCAELSYIGLRSVAWLDDAAVHRLLQSCPRLRSQPQGVALNGSMGVSSACREELEDCGALCYT